MAVATTLIITAGTVTFTNEWYQTKNLDWKVPVVTLFLAAAFDGLAKVNDKAATGIAFIALIGAFTTKFNGKSAIDTLGGLVNQPATKAKQQ
jgi:uncharacterized membrane protein YfcA